jgi:hypothetical protein
MDTLLMSLLHLSLLLTAGTGPGEVAQLEELARGRSWIPNSTRSCSGQAKPQTGRVVLTRAYGADTIWQDVKLTLENYSTAELGFLRPTSWKRLGRFEVRTYRSAAPRNVYYTFSIDTASRAGTTVCAVVWRR